MAVAAPARRAGAAPARRPAPARPARTRRAPARAPRRSRPKPRRSTGAHLIPIAVGTANAVRHLPDSGPMVRMTRGRAWIGVLGLLLAGIVALNVLTLSFAASAGRIEQSIQALDQENSILRSRDAQRSGVARVRHDAAPLGLVVPAGDDVGTLRARPNDAAVAARRLAAAVDAY
jgi:hypothetical protein